jgi:heme O synthase-like polyprenyltransferase
MSQITDIKDFLFGPLDKKWCMYFYIFTVVNFGLFLFLLVLVGITIFGKAPRVKSAVDLFVFSVLYLAIYIKFRILHGMCIHST